MTQANTTGPLVSIIITYYNQDGFIIETVRSALDQTYTNCEVIVVDDGSARPAEPVLKDIGPIKLIRRINGGCPAARNTGATASSGEYLIFLDGDDRLTPNSVQSQLTAFESHPDGVMSFGAAARIDSESKPLRGPHICRPRSNYFLMLLESSPMECPGAAMVRRDAFFQVGQFDEEFPLYGPSEDYDFHLRIARHGPLVRHTDHVVDYRQHGKNLSSNQERVQKGVTRALDKVEADGGLTKAEIRRLRHGRARWTHALHPKQTTTYKIKSLYFSFRAMLEVAFSK